MFSKFLGSFTTTPLKQGLQQTLSTPWHDNGLNETQIVVYSLFQSIYLVPKNMPKTFIDFQYCHFLRKLKMAPQIIEKIVWQKFEN